MVQHVLFQCRFPYDRMVRDQQSKKKKKAKPQKPNQDVEEPVKPLQSPGQKNQDGAESSLEVLDWRQLDRLHLSDENIERWFQREAESPNWPTHVRPFAGPEQYQLVRRTYHQLQHSAYYWGAMSMQEAHQILVFTSAGTFLIRDSGQNDVFFTLSYHAEDGPASVRVVLRELLFALLGSQKTFPSLFDLLAHYCRPSCKLTAPYRRQRPERLKQMCRRALVRTYGADNVRTLTGLSREAKDYVGAYPYSI
ncbi:suppressor of cytokine signaling 1-like [Stigmatopora argus]